MRSLGRLREVLDVAEVEEIAKFRRSGWRIAQRRRRTLVAQANVGMPRYYRSVLEYSLAWLVRHRKPGWECPLAEIVHYLRRDALVALGPDAEQIQDRGVAKMLRTLQFELWRANDGLQARGIRPR